MIIGTCPIWQLLLSCLFRSSPTTQCSDSSQHPIVRQHIVLVVVVLEWGSALDVYQSFYEITHQVFGEGPRP